MLFQHAQPDPGYGGFTPLQIPRGHMISNNGNLGAGEVSAIHAQGGHLFLNLRSVIFSITYPFGYLRKAMDIFPKEKHIHTRIYGGPGLRTSALNTQASYFFKGAINIP